MPGRVYLDFNASAPVDPEVLAVMGKAAADAGGNPSSLHLEGRRARACLDDARERVATILGARPREIVFTSGGTEALHVGLRGAAGARRAKGTGLVVSAMEHPAVLDAVETLGREGFEVRHVPPGSDGTLTADRVDHAATAGTILVAVMAANHETGAIPPVVEIANLVRPRGVLVLCDAALLPGYGDLRTLAAHVDLLALSAHKFGGPKGIGVLFVRRGVRLVATQRGGPQEDQLRGGTENVLGAVGLAAALEKADRERDVRSLAVAARAARLLATLESVPGVALVGPRTGRLPSTVTVEVDGCEGEALLIHLDLAGVAVSTGSACAIGAAQPSPVLLAMGFSRRRAASTIRFSLGPTTTDDEIERAGTIFSTSCARLRALAR